LDRIVHGFFHFLWKYQPSLPRAILSSCSSVIGRIAQAQANSEGCVPWSSITLSNVGQKLCAGGSVVLIDQLNSLTKRLRFDNTTSSFEVFDTNPYDLSAEDLCISVFGIVQNYQNEFP
jgi:hypothetical protein